MMILSLDLGTKVGYYKEGDAKAYTINLGKGDKRFYNFMMFLYNEFNKDYPPTKIIYEGANFQKAWAGIFWHGLLGVLKAMSEAKKIPIEPIHVMTMKSRFLDKKSYTEEDCLKIVEDRNFLIKYKGKGGKTVFVKKKKAPIMARCEDLGIEFDDDNAADSFGVYYTYKKLHEKDNN